MFIQLLQDLWILVIYIMYSHVFSILSFPNVINVLNGIFECSGVIRLILCEGIFTYISTLA